MADPAALRPDVATALDKADLVDEKDLGTVEEVT